MRNLSTIRQTANRKPQTANRKPQTAINKLQSESEVWSVFIKKTNLIYGCGITGSLEYCLDSEYCVVGGDRAVVIRDRN